MMPLYTDDQNEQRLLQRAARDPAAFQTLYDAYFQRVYAYVAAKVNDRLDAEDLVSDIFLQVVKHLGQFNNKHRLSFAAWLFTIARNSVSDFYRRQGRMVSDVALEEANGDEADTPELDQMLIHQEHAAEIRALLDSLPERRREVLMLRYFSGLRNIEIAQVLHIDERTVASHLSRGLRDLYTMYTGQSVTTESGESHD